jgi:hypothetical protein
MLLRDEMILLARYWMRFFAALPSCVRASRMTARQDLPRRSGDDNVDRAEGVVRATPLREISAAELTAALRRRC